MQVRHLSQLQVAVRFLDLNLRVCKGGQMSFSKNASTEGVSSSLAASPSVSPESPSYETYWEKLKESARYHPANRLRYFLITSLARPFMKENTHLIDLGCGDSTILSVLREEFPRGNYTGCDISSKVVELNQARFAGVQYFQADISSKEFLQKVRTRNLQAPDVVVSCEVIEHLKNDEQMLKNVFELLPSGGVFILTTQSGPRYRVDRELLHHLRHYRLDELRNRMRAHGFEVLRSSTRGFPVLNLQKVLVNLFYDSVMKSVGSGGKPGFFARTAMGLMYWGMRLSPALLGGPQLILLARKP